jgi:hypothetical protein
MSRWSQTADERFWSNVDTSGECWEWTGVRNRGGYGDFWFEGRHWGAHRWIMRPIPEGLVIDHLCMNPPCVRRSHLEIVSFAENCRRGVRGVGGVNFRKTACPKGHEYDEANTYVSPKGQRFCRTCAREKQRLLRASRRPSQSA